MAEPIDQAGLASLNPGLSAYLETLEGLRGTGSSSPLNFSPDMEKVDARRAELSAYLGTPDYSRKQEEAKKAAQLQFYLRMAERGFTGAFATPTQRGIRGAIGALSSNVFAPLAGDASALAASYSEKKEALETARLAEERRLKLAAYQGITSEDKEIRDLAKSLVPKTPSMKSATYPDVLVPFGDGETIVKAAANVIVTGPTGGPRVITTLGETTLPDGRVVPSGTVVKSFGKNRQSPSTGRTSALIQNVQATVANPGGGPPITVLANVIAARDSGGENPTVTLNGDIDLGDGKVIPAGTRVISFATTTDPSAAPFEALRFVATRGPNGEPQHANLGVPRQVRLLKENNDIFDVRTDEPVQLQEGQFLATAAELGETSPPAETDAQRASGSRENQLLSEMGVIQLEKSPGTNNAFSARSAFYFDAAAYLAGEQPFKYIPPGTGMNDRSQDVTITNTDVLSLLERRLKAAADSIESDTGSQNQETKPARIREAVRKILSTPPSAVFGATPIDAIGKNSNGDLVGYVPGAGAIDPATVRENARTAMETLSTDRNVSLVDIFRPLPTPDNTKDFNATWGRLSTAAAAFPGVFRYTGEGTPGTEDYDEGLVQQRLDLEANLRNANLVLGASPEDHRAILQKSAQETAEKRQTAQDGDRGYRQEQSDTLAERLSFRSALLQFRNAAAQTNVAGFVTGTLAGGAAKLGFAPFIAGEGAEHWERLKVASDRMESGYSRREGRQFGDTRISNYDAADYKMILPSIRKGEEFNAIIIENALARNSLELNEMMEEGGNVGWSRRQLEDAARAGVNFAALRTKQNWHGHGFYGRNRYQTSRQLAPTLNEVQRSDLRTQGQLRDAMYGGQFTVPLVNYSDDSYSFNADTKVSRMGPLQLRAFIKNRAEATGISVQEFRKRITQGIIAYGTFRRN